MLKNLPFVIIPFALSLWTLRTSASFIHSNLVVHQSPVPVPKQFIDNGPAPPDLKIDLRIALIANDLPGLEDQLYAVSELSSNKYGQYLSKDEVESYVRPSEETIAVISAWLSSNSIDFTSPSTAGNWIHISIPVSQANELLGTQFRQYAREDDPNGKKYTRTLSYSIPSNLVGHIELIYPTVTFPIKSTVKPTFYASRTASEAQSEPCSDEITPACLQSLYNIPSTPATKPSNQLAVSGFGDQYANEQDLMAFLTNFRPDIDPSTTFTVQSVDGGQNLQVLRDAGLEADLDIQYTIGLATNVPTTFITVGADDLTGFVDLFSYLLSETNPPQVISTSYGFDESQVGNQMAINLCNIFMQLGARGVSILFASGDGGVAGAQDKICGKFQATFPSSCPYVTSVGATTGYPTESAADFSAGGFSEIFSAPSYQSSATTSYISSLGNKYAGKFNGTGRGFPDLSAQGQNVVIFNKLEEGTVDGTSASSPIVASVIALLNDALVAQGKSPLGFLNPLLYSTAGSQALNDITDGDNPGCGTNGFSASTGWDPVTGLGTPSYDKLRTLIGV